jgi:hypothetical protein
MARFVGWCLAGVVGLAGVAQASLLAAADGFKSPPIEAKTDWIAILVAVLALLGTCAAAFKNARRTHLD